MLTLYDHCCSRFDILNRIHTKLFRRISCIHSTMFTKNSSMTISLCRFPIFGLRYSRRKIGRSVATITRTGENPAAVMLIISNTLDKFPPASRGQAAMGSRSGHNAPSLARQVLCLRANFTANQNASSRPFVP